jgi:hypothetical protein
MKPVLLLLITFSFVMPGKGQLISFKNASGKYGFKNASGVIKIPAVYDVVFSTFQEGMLCVNKGFKTKIDNNTETILSSGKWGYINEAGREVIPLQFERAVAFTDGIARVMDKGMWGVINKQGKFVIPPVYATIGYFEI